MTKSTKILVFGLGSVALIGVGIYLYNKRSKKNNSSKSGLNSTGGVEVSFDPDELRTALSKRRTVSREATNRKAKSITKE